MVGCLVCMFSLFCVLLLFLICLFFFNLNLFFSCRKISVVAEQVAL